MHIARNQVRVLEHQREVLITTYKVTGICIIVAVIVVVVSWLGGETSTLKWSEW